MATEEDACCHDHNHHQQEDKGKKTAKHDSGAADLEKVTDYVEEAEEKLTTESIGNAMKVVSDRKAKEAAQKLERERELSKVKIKKEDVDLIVHEIEISRTLAERTLREHKGNLVEALTSLTN